MFLSEKVEQGDLESDESGMEEFDPDDIAEMVETADEEEYYQQTSLEMERISEVEERASCEEESNTNPSFNNNLGQDIKKILDS